MTPARPTSHAPPPEPAPAPCTTRPTRRSPITARRGECGSTSALELMALTPMCALLVAFITWAANTGQAQLAVTLAAQEAATAAAVCCTTAASEPQPTDNGRTDDDAPATAHDPDTARQLAAESVIAARPSLERLCVGGPKPGAPHRRWISRTTAPIAPGRPDTAIAVVTAHITCTTDGAAVPLRGLFDARTVHGHGTHINTAADTRTPPQPPEPTEPSTGDTP